MDKLNEMFNEYDKFNKRFKAKTYVTAAEEFYGKYSDIFENLNKEAEDSVKQLGEIDLNEELEESNETENKLISDTEQSRMGIFRQKNDEKLAEIVVAAPKVPKKVQDIVDRISDEFVKKCEQIISKNGKHPVAGKLMSINIFMTMYVFPGIIAVKGTYSVNLSETIAKKWNATFRNTSLSCSDYDTINSGFKKRCYITTAVCESLGKSDDCRELNVLRSFRDEYMMNSENGRKMVEQYYSTAPSIVGAINTRSDADVVYKDLYNKYISPCITMIDTGKMEECMKHYKKMVESLE